MTLPRLSCKASRSVNTMVRWDFASSTYSAYSFLTPHLSDGGTRKLPSSKISRQLTHLHNPLRSSAECWINTKLLYLLIYHERLLDLASTISKSTFFKKVKYSDPITRVVVTIMPWAPGLGKKEVVGEQRCESTTSLYPRNDSKRVNIEQSPCGHIKRSQPLNRMVTDSR